MPIKKSRKKVIKRSSSLSFINFPRATYIKVFSLALLVTSVFFTVQLASSPQDPRGRAATEKIYKVGDLNRDDVINGTDIAILQSKIGTYDRQADLNGDGKVNEEDLNILLRLVGK